MSVSLHIVLYAVTTVVVAVAFAVLILSARRYFFVLVLLFAFFFFAAVPGSHQVINMFEKLPFAGEYARCTMCCACKDVFEHENILYEYLCISIET